MPSQVPRDLELIMPPAETWLDYPGHFYAIGISVSDSVPTAHGQIRRLYLACITFKACPLEPDDATSSTSTPCSALLHPLEWRQERIEEI